ncbi:sensory protein [Pseudorhodoferax sp. Leaf267]|nr:sensory protein [Pseudorhodoferax sp. Leaf267]
MLAWLALCYAVAAVGAAASLNSAGIYDVLDRPAWAPPASVFGPVWTALYAMMAVAAWQVWRARGWARGSGALLLFVLQLVANALWTWLFFRWQQGALAFADVALLWLLLAATVVVFWRIRRSAGLLLLPYLAWVSFACALSWSIWQRNPQVL